MSEQDLPVMTTRPVGVLPEPVFYTPPKYGPPPGYSMEKWRTMNRKQRRDVLKSLTSAVNQAAGNRETCQHGQLVGQCTECAKTTGRPTC